MHNAIVLFLVHSEHCAHVSVIQAFSTGFLLSKCTTKLYTQSSPNFNDPTFNSPSFHTTRMSLTEQAYSLTPSLSQTRLSISAKEIELHQA